MPTDSAIAAAPPEEGVAAPADAFAGLTEVKAEAPPARDPFSGLQEVKSSDDFAGLKPADRLDTEPHENLAKDSSFRPAQYLAENPDVSQDPERLKKLLDVYRQKRIAGLNLGEVAKAAVTEAPGIIAKTVKGAGQLASRLIDIGVQPAVNEVLGHVTGTDINALREETGRKQLKAAGEITSGTEQAVTSLAQLAQQGGRKLFGVSPEKATDSELQNQLLLDSEFHKQLGAISQGKSDTAKSLGLDADFLSKNGVVLDPKAIENLSLVDPLTLVATAGIFKVVGVGGRVLATAASKAGAQAVLNGLKTVAAKSVQVAGRGAELAGKVVQKIPVKTPSAAVVGGQIATGNIPGAAAAAAVPIAVKAGGKALEVAGRTAAEVAQAATPGFIGPPTAAATRIAEIAASPAGKIAGGVAKGAATGAIVAAPLAAASDESQTAGAILGGGAALGAIAGGAGAAGHAVANAVAKNYLDPHSIPFEPVKSPGYGIDATLDTAHEAAMKALPAPEQNAINNFREALRQQGGEIYTLDRTAYENQARADQVKQNGGNPLTPEQEAAVKTYADTHATFDGTITDAAGQNRRVVFLNANAKGLPHDAGHLFQSLLEPARQAELRQSALDSYTPEQLKQFGDAYAARLGEPDYFAKLGETAGRNKIADELIAENFSQLFGNTPLTDLKAPPKFLNTLGRTAAGAAESLGIDLTAGRATPDLAANPSYRLQNVLRGAAREVLNAPEAQPKVPFRTQGELPLAEPPKAAEIPAATAPEKPPVTPAEITPPEAKPVVADEAAKRAEATGIDEARQLAKDNPETAATVETIAKSMQQGNLPLRIEHRGITSEAPVGPRGEARVGRRGTQETGYEELRRLQVENRKNAPESVVSVHEKTFVPVRWVNQGGKPTLIAMSMDKVIGNIRKVVDDAAANKADKLIPYESVGGELTPEAWDAALSDIKDYSENQANGYRGDGKPLVRPPESAGASIPAENPSYTPKPLDEAKANFANLVQGIAPPETARMTKGQVPGNVKAQMIAEANARTPQPLAKVAAKDITKQNFKAPFENRSIKETNALRNQLSSKGVNIRNLTEVTERLAAEDIGSVAPAGTQHAAPVTDIIRGGFLPAGGDIKATADQILAAKPDEWRSFIANSKAKNLTQEAYRVGLNLTDKSQLETLRDAQKTASDQYAAARDTAKASGDPADFDAAMAQSTKVQFFREAVEAATDSGSAAGTYGWRKVMPEGKPPFAGEGAKPAALDKGELQRLFLPTDKVAADSDPITFAAIRTEGGHIFKGSFHGEAYLDLAEAIGRGELNERLPAGFKSLTDLLDSVIGGEPNSFVEDGFVTKSGKFLNRAEALDHAEKIGQLKANETLKEGSPRAHGVLETDEFNRQRSFLPKALNDIREQWRDFSAEMGGRIRSLSSSDVRELKDEIAGKPRAHENEAPALSMAGTGFESHKEMVDHFANDPEASGPTAYTIKNNPGTLESMERAAEYLDDPKKYGSDKFFESDDAKHSLWLVQTTKNDLRWKSGYYGQDSIKSAVTAAVQSGLRSVLDKVLPGKSEAVVDDIFGKFKDLDWPAITDALLEKNPHLLAENPKSVFSDVAEKLQFGGEGLNLNGLSKSEQKVFQSLFNEGKRELSFPASERTGQAFLPKEESLAAIRSGKKDGETFNSDGTVFVPKSGQKLDVVTLASKNVPVSDLTQEKVSAALKPYAAALKHPDIKAGIFKLSTSDADGNPQASVDINVIVDQQHRDNSLAFAKANNQEAIFDLHNSKTVDTGGNGQTILTDPDKIASVADSLVKGESPAFLPKKKSKVLASDITKRDDEGRPLTRAGLVDYEKLYAEKTKQDKEQQTADLASIPEGKYNVPKSEVPKSGDLTGWLLPDGKFEPLNASYHEQFLANNAEALNKKFGTKLSSTPDVEARFDALQKGFVRVRYTPNDGALRIEAAASNWSPKVRKAILDRIESNLDSVDRVYAAVMDEKGNVVDSVSEKVAELDGPEKLGAITDAVNGLKTSTKSKNVGPSDIQRARAFGEPSYLPKGGTKDFNNYVADRIKDSKSHPEALPLDFRKDDNGNYRAGFGGEPVMVAKSYDLSETPLAQSSKTEDKFVNALSKGLEREYRNAKKNPEVEAGERWYSTFREKIHGLLGDDSKLFAELLGATSPQTNVDANFGYALDAYNQFKSGAYDAMLEKYREGKQEFAAGNLDQFEKETGKTGAKATYNAFMGWWTDKHNLIPESSKGKRFGLNSKAVMRVLDGSWASQVQGPKTPNFVGNLAGTSFEATIDVWAMRLLHRIANEGNKSRWRIQPGNEMGVTDPDFFLGQKAFRQAAEKVGIKPDALQAILWFAEKNYWTDKGWTKTVGSKKSDFNSLIANTEKTAEGKLRRVDKQLSFSDIEGNKAP